MENDIQTDCSCSLINFKYTVKKDSAFYPARQHRLPKKPTTTNKKPKYSLSRSLSGINFYQESDQQRDSMVNFRIEANPGKYQKCNIYDTSSQQIQSRFTKQSRLKKKSMNSNLKKQKFCSDLERTKNTAFDNSLEYFQLRNSEKPNAADPTSFSFYKDKDTQIKRQSRNSEAPFSSSYQVQQKQQNPSIKAIPNSSNMTQMRRIKTLKQLGCRNVHSMGGVSSDNHASMIISIEQSKQQSLGQLDLLARKSLSYASHAKLAKTEQGFKWGQNDKI